MAVGFPILSAARRSPRKNRHLNVLIADDDLISIGPLLVALAESSVQFTTAESAQDALSVLDHKDFDLLIFDMKMPDLSGEEALKVAQTRVRSSRIIPVVFFTGTGTRMPDLKCLELPSFNVQDVWQKQMAYSSLKGRLAETLKKLGRVA